MYDRAKVTLGSSGFEHVFMGECCKGGNVGGFHNWWHYYYLEKQGTLNYLGYWEQASFGQDMAQGGGISFTFTWDGTSKPYGSMFVGTSPELEMALYTVCFITRYKNNSLICTTYILCVQMRHCVFIILI